jgi:YesN/AraC family two-component response regulator
MSPKQIEKLFQLDKNNISRGTAGEQGTGLGLVIAYEFIKTNDGTIQVESELGKGTTFHVTVPASRNQQPAVQKQILIKQSNENQNGVEVWEKFPTEMLVKIKGKKILIVDDNKELRTYLRFILSSTFEIFEAENGKEGISIANQIQPAIIISDLIMPVMSGTEFCKAIKTATETSHIPFILLTSQSAEESQLLGYEAGADVYLPKPVKKEILVRVIANFIHNQEKIWKKINENFLDANTTYIPDLSVSEVDQALLNKLIDFIESNVTKQNIDAIMICQHLGVSRTVLYAKIKALTGQGVHEFIKSLRLKKSLKMLLEGKYTIGQITQEVGFTSHSYFNRCFVKQYGMTPKDYINSRKQKKA